MQLEKERFEETVGAMAKQLMDFVDKMNKLEVESVSHHLSFINSRSILTEFETVEIKC